MNDFVLKLFGQLAGHGRNNWIRLVQHVIVRVSLHQSAIAFYHALFPLLPKKKKKNEFNIYRGVPCERAEFIFREVVRERNQEFLAYEQNSPIYTSLIIKSTVQTNWYLFPHSIYYRCSNIFKHYKNNY